LNRVISLLKYALILKITIEIKHIVTSIVDNVSSTEVMRKTTNAILDLLMGSYLGIFNKYFFKIED